MGIQEWTIVIGVIVGVTVLLWMAARWRKRRYDDIYSYEASDTDEPDANYGSELPSGGARTVGYRDPSDIERMNQEIRERADTLKPRLSPFESAPREQQALFEEPAESGIEQDGDADEEQIPLLLDPSEEHSEPTELEAREQESIGQVPSEPQQDTEAPEVSRGEPEGDELSSEPFADESEQISAPESFDSSEPLVAGKGTVEPEIVPNIEKDSLEPIIPASKTEPSEEQLKKEKRSKKRGRKQTVEPKPEPSEPAEIIIINLMTSPEAAYEGQPLLRALTELGMRFGDMDIFHYCGKHGDEAPQFRLANLMNPGVFDIDNIGDLRTHALCFFYELEPEADNMSIYESMLSVISKLKDELGGEMRDDQRSVFTIQTSEHCRNRIRDFQRRHLVRKP